MTRFKLLLAAGIIVVLAVFACADMTGAGLGRPSDGDVNCDGSTDPLDALLVLQYDARLLRQPPACHVAGDVDQDGAVTIIDAALILQFDAGLLEELPV